MSEQRVACCILCVTMTIVNCSFRVSISSSTLAVAIGSSAEQGSSIRIISGLQAIARAMQKGRLSASGRTNESGYSLFGNLKIDSKQRLRSSVMKIDVFDVDNRRNPFGSRSA